MGLQRCPYLINTNLLGVLARIEMESCHLNQRVLQKLKNVKKWRWSILSSRVVFCPDWKGERDERDVEWLLVWPTSCNTRWLFEKQTEGRKRKLACKNKQRRTFLRVFKNNLFVKIEWLSLSITEHKSLLWTQILLFYLQFCIHFSCYFDILSDVCTSESCFQKCLFWGSVFHTNPSLPLWPKQGFKLSPPLCGAITMSWTILSAGMG